MEAALRGPAGESALAKYIIISKQSSSSQHQALLGALVSSIPFPEFEFLYREWY